MPLRFMPLLRLMASLLLAVGAPVAASEVTPVAKVLDMLEGMLGTCKEAKHTEEVEFAEFKKWCESVRDEKAKSIAEETAQIGQLSADIDKATSDAAMLGEEVAQLQTTIAEMNAEVANATAVRKKERSHYEGMQTDVSESIAACQRAIQVLKARSADIPQSLLQLRRSLALSAQDRSAIDAFLGLGQAPQPNAYEFQSGNVVEMLEKLGTKFKEERTGLQKAEMAKRHNFEMLVQRLTDSIKAAQASVSDKAGFKSRRLEEAAAAKGDLAMTTKVKGEDEQSLSDTNVLCHARSEEYETNQVTRSDEIKSLGKAIEILSSEKVIGHSETYLPSMLQQSRKGAALVQLKSDGSGAGATAVRASAYLQARAAKLGSRYLALMAAHASADPFGKVRKMIEELIYKLQAEANAEADRNAYCQTELATNKLTRENKAAEAEALVARVDKLTADTQQLTTEIQELSDAISEAQGQQAEATKMRGEENATNAKTIADAKEAQVAVERALQVLRDFYSNAGPPAALVQRAATRRGAKAGAGHAEPYTGLQDDSTGVLGMLDVILSDFARLESETSSAEDQAVRAHKMFMVQSERDVEVKATEVKHKDGEKMQKTEALAAAKEELRLTQEELDAASEYYAKLKANCLDDGLSYEERKDRRKEEIESLKEALRILNDGSLA
mmetsp:Transcript_114252/g.323069  ORF Transcript_114252/g.323069 Transcript_114252/m.323069 type:complete len:672 (-) Transcript_114252:81-2096(-)